MDHRETAWDPFRGSFNENTMIGLLYGDGEPVRCHMAVCSVCDGRGSYVNPAIDSHGLSPEDFYEDEDFAESYFRGHYDMTCEQCGGKRVEPVPNDDDPNKELYDEAVRGHYEMLAEYAAERRMGA